jgi:hypothetical protein
MIYFDCSDADDAQADELNFEDNADVSFDFLMADIEGEREKYAQLERSLRTSLSTASRRSNLDTDTVAVNISVATPTTILVEKAIVMTADNVMEWIQKCAQERNSFDERYYNSP